VRPLRTDGPWSLLLSQLFGTLRLGQPSAHPRPLAIAPAVWVQRLLDGPIEC
jgi:hypothetical protein